VLFEVTINARIRPMQRGEIYEDVLAEILAQHSLGSVLGAGSMLLPSGEIGHCNIEIEVSKPAEATALILAVLEEIGVPKGSKIKECSTGSEIPFGTLEGLAIYLNDTDLEPEVYENCDPNHVYNELDRLVDGVGKVFNYWEGPNETAFYLYGSSYLQMKALITEFTQTYPLCQKCRIEQIA